MSHGTMKGLSQGLNGSISRHESELEDSDEDQDDSCAEMIALRKEDNRSCRSFKNNRNP